MLIPLGLLIGLAIGFLFSNLTPASTISIVSTPTPSLAPRPFVTMKSAFMVRLHFFRTRAPEVISVTRISGGRISILPSGENEIQMLDADEQVVYRQSFQVQYLYGDLPKPADQVTQIFVLPIIDGAHTIVVTTPQGKTRYEIPTP